MTNRPFRAWAMPLVMTTGILAGCAGTGLRGEQPVLYPNAAYKAMGEAAARQHLDQCVALARQSGLRTLHRPANLEDVFLKLTGRELRD